MIDTAIDPKQPRRLEKKRNTKGPARALTRQGNPDKATWSLQVRRSLMLMNMNDLTHQSVIGEQR